MNKDIFKEYEELKLMYLAQLQRNSDLMFDVSALLAENEKLLEVFKKSFDDIADFSSDFRTNYENFLMQMGYWMISQKAYKELALRYAEIIGIPTDSVKTEAKNLEINVISKSNPIINETNLSKNTPVAKVAHKLLKLANKKTKTKNNS